MTSNGSRIRDITYASDGDEVPARLYLPDRAEEGPGVLLCPGRLREVEGLSFLAEALVTRGHVVLATSYRGMDMSTDDRDCTAGLDLLGDMSEVDQRRLAMVGHSRGAMASLRVAARDDRVRAVVALQPVTDLTRYVTATRDYAPTRYGHLTAGLGGTPEERPEVYEALSALRFADRIRVPVLLVAGTADLHSPIDHSLWMRDALNAAGNPDVELEVLEGMGHFFEQMYAGYARDTVADRTVAWLARTLAPDHAAAAKDAP